MKRVFLILALSLSGVLLAPAADPKGTHPLAVDASGFPTSTLNLGGTATPVYDYLQILGHSGLIYHPPTPATGNALFYMSSAGRISVKDAVGNNSSVALDSELANQDAANLTSDTVAAARVTVDAGLTISAAGITHLVANGAARTSRKITLAAGSGPYLADFILDVPTASTGVSADANGSWQDIRLEFSAGGNAGVRILAADGATVLFSEAVTPSSSIPAYAVDAQFVCPTTAWRLHDTFLTP